MIQPKLAPQRNAFHAVKRRRAHARRTRYAGSARVIAVLGIVVFPIMLYVMLTANLTGLNFAIGHAEAERGALQEEMQRLDDQIAHLESRERLAVVAAKLGMREPQRYEVVTIPEPVADVPKPGGIALLSWFVRP
ncbi:MAG: hypothetical protein JO140_02850 [Candidatus Eremiobacteraeota bacterium]|nr:hypothetical protein [Candidatus Eremiobacteraeota bacterium]